MTSSLHTFTCLGEYHFLVRGRRRSPYSHRGLIKLNQLRLKNLDKLHVIVVSTNQTPLLHCSNSSTVDA
jgi:hypothetical protein